MKNKFLSILLLLGIISFGLTTIHPTSSNINFENELKFSQKGYQDAKLYLYSQDMPISTYASRYQVNSCQEAGKYTNQPLSFDIYHDFLKYQTSTRGEIASSTIKKINYTNTLLLGGFEPLFNTAKNPGFCSMIANLPTALNKVSNDLYKYDPIFLQKRYQIGKISISNQNLEYYSNLRFKFITQNSYLSEIRIYHKENLDRTIFSIHFSQINL